MRATTPEEQPHHQPKPFPIPSATQLQQNPLTSTLLQSQNYIQIQHFNLKANLLSTGLPKKQFDFYTHFYSLKITNKYQHTINHLERLIQEIKCELKLAQANQIRSLNNVIKVFLKRTNMTDHCPVKQFKTNTLDQQEKYLLQRLILSPHVTCTEPESKKLLEITNQIATIIQNAETSLKATTTLPEINNDSKMLVNILNQCDIHLWNRVNKFQDTRKDVEKVIRKAIDGLNEYWNGFEEIGARLVMEVKSSKEKQLEMIIAKSQEKSPETHYSSSNDYENYPRGGFNNHPYASNPALPKSNSSLKPKAQSLTRKLGQMSNKRKGKLSILQSGEKKIMQLISSWYVGNDKEEKYLSGDDLRKRNDFWSTYYLREKDEDKNGARQTLDKKSSKSPDEGNHYELENLSSPQSLEHLLTRTYPAPGDIQSLYYYDQHPAIPFSLQHPISNLLESRLIFQAWHHTKLESEFYQISQLLTENQNKVDKLQQKEKKEADGYGIGFKKADRADQRKALQRFVKEGFDEEFLPQVVKWANIEDQNDEDAFWESQEKEKIDKGKVFQNLSQFSNLGNSQPQNESKNVSDGKGKREKGSQIPKKQQILSESSSSTNNKPELHLNESTNLKQQGQSFSQPSVQNTTTSAAATYQPTLLSSLIQCYFINIQTKYSRLAKDQKTHRTYYFPSIDTAAWERVCGQFREVERVFVVLEEPNICLVRMEKLYNMHREMIKCVVHMFSGEIKQVEKQFLRKKVNGSLGEEYMVTFSFKPIKGWVESQANGILESKSMQKASILKYLPCKNVVQVQYLTGVLTVLIYEEKLEQAEYETGDFLGKGEELIKEYELYFSEDKENIVHSFNEFFKLDHNYYQKLAKINYLFDIENDDGLAFNKLSDAAMSKIEEEKVEVFKARAKKLRKKSKFDEEDDQGAIEEDEDESEDEEDEGDDGRPIFVPRTQGDGDQDDQTPKDKTQKPKETVKETVKESTKQVPKQGQLTETTIVKKQVETKEKEKRALIEDRELKAPELVLDQKKPVGNDNKDGLKRSNSREELKNMKVETLFLQIPTSQGYGQEEEEQQVEDDDGQNLSLVQHGEDQHQHLEEKEEEEEEEEEEGYGYEEGQEEDDDMVGL